MIEKLLMDHDLSKLKFLVTGGAGFIGCNLVETLLAQGAGSVRALDNFSNGKKENVQEFLSHPNFELIEGDISVMEHCMAACESMDFVLHQAALGSVPRSIRDPLASNQANVSGFVNMLFAAVNCKVKRFVFASSSSVYGDDQTMPKIESKTGNLLSPYAVTKMTNELYAQVFSRTYDLEIIGLRYFNVFGPKQSVDGPYAAVIPIFINELLCGRAPGIFGDGTTTRDFTYVENVVQANILAALTGNRTAINTIYNIAYGGTTSLNSLFINIAVILKSPIKVNYLPERKGDIKDSFANIEKAKNLLGYSPTVDIRDGLARTVEWYQKQLKELQIK